MVLCLCWACSNPAETVDEDLVDLWVEAEVLYEVSDSQHSPDVELRVAETLEICESGDCGEVLDVAAEDCEVVNAGGFGWACVSADDCLSGYCFDLGSQNVCSVNCVEECPAGWSCQQDGGSLPDIVYVCAPTGVTYCSPCLDNGDCTLGAFDVGSACVGQGDAGAFCGTTCTADEDCPEGANCIETATMEGPLRWQCVPAAGECTCSSWAVKAAGTTSCMATNESGTCPGSRMCVDEGTLSPCDAPIPTAELCNGLDDDCDGEVDEELGETTCGLGICEHTVQNCVAGKEQQCDALAGALKDEVCNNEDDDCDGVVDNGLVDTDDDGTPDCLDYDDDEDGWLDQQDNCPFIANPGQENFDLDTLGDLCDPDDDNDKSADGEDCEPFNDAVFPKKSEACNGIDDNCSGLVDDGLGESTCGKGECVHTVANCEAGVVQVCDPFAGAQPEECDGLDNDCDGATDDGFSDLDEDGAADCVDVDDDGDEVPDDEDNCPLTPNGDQADVDLDGFGDLCDFGCFIVELAEWEVDCDGLPDELDNCPALANVEQSDTDKDGMGDLCDSDDDGDGIADELDNCLLTHNSDQEDLDGDGIGDACEEDLDGDGVLDSADNCPVVANKAQKDNDKDEIGDECDPDDDNDTDPDLIDCAPLNPFVSHLATESCNGIDDDCDFATDEEDAGGCVPHYLDIDADQYGVTAQVKCLCGPDDLYTALVGGDCKPLDEDINPGHEELCNGIDDNCDEVVDEGLADNDEDGQADCVDPDDDDDGLSDDADNCPFVGNAEQLDFDEDDLGDACDEDDDNDQTNDDEDCSPFDAAVFPGNNEECNGKDSDCNGIVDDGLGETTCGKGLCEHTVPNCLDGVEQFCDPLEGASDEVCNGLDDNCSGETDEDFEVGVSCIVGLGQCQDEGLTACLKDGTGVYCVAEEGEKGTEFCNGKDDDCDGEVDEELGTTTCGLGECVHAIDNCVGGEDQVCDPMDGVQPESCDGKDNDCDDEIDEELGTTTCGLGECMHTIPFCQDGAVLECDPFEGAVDETCNGLDDDCNGLTDDGLGVTTCGLGPCNHSVLNCVDGEVQVCDPMLGSIDEVCNNADEDCDGVVDNDLTQACSTICGGGIETCVAGEWVNCDAATPTTEVCDDNDNDCDGATDEGWSAECQDITCNGNGHIQTIPDGCINDGGMSAGGDALQVFCCFGIARFCLSGEACPWRNGCVESNDTCSRAGLGSDFMADAFCGSFEGHQHFYCNSQNQIYF